MSNETDSNNPQSSETQTETSTETQTTDPALLADDTSEGEKGDTGNLLGGDGDDPAAGSDDGEPAAFGIDEIDRDALGKALGDQFKLDDDIFGKFADAVNKAGSRQELAENILRLYEETETAAAESMAQEWNALQESWKDEVKKDPDIGGANMPAALAKAKELINTHASDPAAVKQILTQTGAGNSVHIVKLLVSLADAIPGEARPAEGSPGSTPKSVADRLFGGKT